MSFPELCIKHEFLFVLFLFVWFGFGMIGEIMTSEKQILSIFWLEQNSNILENYKQVSVVTTFELPYDIYATLACD